MPVWESAGCSESGISYEDSKYHQKVIQKEEALESLGEELRVLYVALTRAKEKLIITGTLSKPEDKIAGYQMFGKDTEGTLSFSQLSHVSTYWDWILASSVKVQGGSVQNTDPAYRGCGKRKHRGRRKERSFKNCS